MVIPQCPQLPAAVKVIVDVANYSERSHAEHDNRDPKRNRDVFAQNPKDGCGDDEEANMNRYRLCRQSPILFQLFDFLFGGHAEMRGCRLTLRMKCDGTDTSSIQETRNPAVTPARWLGIPVIDC